jgi:DNA-binding PucR family transcriptional regulator
MSAAATSLHVHRNTLLYRLRQIDELLEVDVGDADCAFALDLALRILEVRDSISENAGTG